MVHWGQPVASRALIGRTREIELLDQAMRSARNGAGRFVLLTGEAGIGKSLCWLKTLF